MDLRPNTKLGQYTIVRKLAEGGMAEIYLAQISGASGSSKRVVIQRVKARFGRDPKFRARFVEAANRAALLSHPNIVEVHDSGSIELKSWDPQLKKDVKTHELFVAMEYVRGCSLEHLRAGMPDRLLPPFLAAKIVAAVAEALAYAHGRLDRDGKPLEPVHGVITPCDILLSRDGEVKVAPSGVAEPASNETSGRLRSPAYMAPEQAAPGGKVDERTDVFALGVVLYELCTGERPYTADSDVAYIHELATGQGRALPAHTRRKSVPEDLSELLDLAVRREPGQRPQSVKEFAQRLTEILKRASDAERDLTRVMRELLGPEDPADAPQPTSVATTAGAESRLHARNDDPGVGLVPPAMVTPVPSDVAAVRGAVTPPAAVEDSRAPVQLIAAPPRFGRGGKFVVGGLVFAVIVISAAYAYYRQGSDVRAQTAVPSGSPAPMAPEAAP